MQIGKPSYKKCSNCGKKLEFYSGPFFVHYYGLTEWSDGEKFRELPSLKETKLQRCPYCLKFYWFNQKLGLGGLNFYDYFEALLLFEKKYSKKSIIKSIFKRKCKKRLLYIRLNILRKFNDKIRLHPLEMSNYEPEIVPEKDKIIFLNNAKELIELLKDLEPNNHFLIAELYRNLGMFEDAKSELNNVNDEIKKNLLLNEINKKNRDVIIINQSRSS
jgi:hypothetical protein